MFRSVFGSLGAREHRGSDGRSRQLIETSITAGKHFLLFRQIKEVARSCVQALFIIPYKNGTHGSLRRDLLRNKLFLFINFGGAAENSKV